MNPYLKRKRDEFAELRTKIEAFQTLATKENRDLNKAELDEIVKLSTKQEELRDEIETLTDAEVRSADVTALAARIGGAADTDDDKPDADKTRSAADDKPDADKTRVGRVTTKDRDPGHYRSVKDGGQNSFFGDMLRAKEENDAPSMQRLAEHHRALSTGSQGPGLVAPHWLTEEFETLARQGRDVANSVRHIDLGTDPRPITLPKQTVGTDAVVAEQANENDPVPGTDAYDTDVDIVTPKPTAGKQTVSRQMIDMSDPAIDQLVYGDLMGVYNFKVEAKVCAALLAAAGVGATAIANEAAFQANAPGNAVDATIDTETAVWAARFLPPDNLACSIPRFGKFRKLKDTTGRPLMPFSSYGVMNAAGVVTTIQKAEIEGLEAHGSAGMGTGLVYPEKTVIYRGMDTILFESNVLRFRFEEQAGPESIVLGVWGYTGVIVRQGGKSTKYFAVTAA